MGEHPWGSLQIDAYPQRWHQQPCPWHCPWWRQTERVWRYAAAATEAQEVRKTKEYGPAKQQAGKKGIRVLGRTSSRQPSFSTLYLWKIKCRTVIPQTGTTLAPLSSPRGALSPRWLLPSTSEMWVYGYLLTLSLYWETGSSPNLSRKQGSLGPTSLSNDCSISSSLFLPGSGIYLPHFHPLPQSPLPLYTPLHLLGH